MCSTEKCVDEHRRQKVYLKPEHLRLKLQDDEEIGAATLGWLDAHGFSGSQARPRPLPRPPTPHFRHRARACLGQGRRQEGVVSSGGSEAAVRQQSRAGRY